MHYDQFLCSHEHAKLHTVYVGLFIFRQQNNRKGAYDIFWKRRLSLACVLCQHMGPSETGQMQVLS